MTWSLAHKNIWQGLKSQLSQRIDPPIHPSFILSEKLSEILKKVGESSWKSIGVGFEFEITLKKSQSEVKVERWTENPILFNLTFSFVFCFVVGNTDYILICKGVRNKEVWTGQSIFLQYGTTQ